MQESDLKLYGRLLREIEGLLDHKNKLGITNLPAEFSGITSDMLYDEHVSNEAFVLFVDGLIQEAYGKNEDEILHRFELCSKVLTEIYERAKKISGSA